jgi:hypothetical protein
MIEVQVPARPSPALGKAGSTSELHLRPAASGPRDFDTLCDAVVAAMRSPGTPGKAAPGILHLYNES